MMVIHQKKEKPCRLGGLRRSFFSAIFVFLFLGTSVFATPLARVNDAPIDAYDVKIRVQSYLRQIGHKRLSPVRMASLEKEVLKKVIEEELLYQEALQSDLSVTAQEIAAGVEKIRQRFPSEEAYVEGLSKESLSLQELEKGVSRSILIQKLWQRLLQMDVVARDDYVREMTKTANIEIFETQVFTGLKRE